MEQDKKPTKSQNAEESEKLDDLLKDVVEHEDEFIEQLPEPLKDAMEQNPEVKSFMLAAVTSKTTSYSSPYPPPEILREYEDLVPGVAKDLLYQGINQGKHRMELEKEVIIREVKMGERGQIFAFISFLVALLAAGILAVVYGQTVLACTIAGATVVGVVAAFITGRKRQEQHFKKEEKKK